MMMMMMMMDDTAWADDLSIGSIDHHPLLVRPSFELFPTGMEYSSEGILPPRPTISTSLPSDHLRDFPAPTNNDGRDSMRMVSNRRLEGNTTMDDAMIMDDDLL